MALSTLESCLYLPLRRPFVWLEYPDGTKQYVGGREYFCEWAAAQEEFAGSQRVLNLALKKHPDNTEKNPFTAVAAFGPAAKGLNSDFKFDGRSGMGKERKMTSEPVIVKPTI